MIRRLSMCFLVLIPQIVFSQNSNISKDKFWDLDRYVWSHVNANKREDDKPPLNFEALEGWRGLSDYLSVSNNGEYFVYGTQKGSNYSKRSDSVIVQSTDKAWRIAFSFFPPGFFSSDSKSYVFRSWAGLCFLHNGFNDIDTIKNVVSYKTTPDKKGLWMAYLFQDNVLVIRNLVTGIEKRLSNVGNYEFDKSSQWLYVRMNSDAKELVVINLDLNKKFQYEWVDDFLFNDAGSSMVLKTLKTGNSGLTKTLEFINLSKGESNEIWSTLDSNSIVSDYAIDASGNRVVFTIADRSIGNSIWYWQKGYDKATLKIKNGLPGLPADMLVKGNPSFIENNNSCIQFVLEHKLDEQIQEKGYGIQIDIWDYKDDLLQSDQLNDLKNSQSPSYKAIYNFNTESVMQLEKEGYQLKCIKDDYAVIAKSISRQKSGGTPGARFWEKGFGVDSNWLVCLRDNSLRELPTTRIGDGFVFSPSGRYLIFCNNEEQCNYFSYELSTGNLLNISKGLPGWKLAYYIKELTGPQYPKTAVGIAGWLEYNNAVLVYDNYDIWQLDFKGRKLPVNLTNGYGRRNNIIFSLFNNSQPQNFFGSAKTISVNKDSSLLIRAFDKRNKFNGFYIKKMNIGGDPIKLYMGPYLFSTPNCVDVDDQGMIPVKAMNNDVWIVKRQSATDAPNYFITKDFKSYKRLTNLQSQANYNWLTAELHSFKQLDGSTGHGILYKPENFDSTKKYPVIITFYFHLSDRSFQYYSPGYITKPSIFEDPSWMVSHGYLVFVADIYFPTDKLGWGYGVMNSLDGAAKFLSQMPYIDRNAIGSAGHSNSGRFSYYLFTHSKRFAAFAIGAGTGGVNAISTYLGNERNSEWLYWGESEVNLGNLWKHKAMWIDHTAVLQVDKAISPLLLFFNNQDHGYGLYSYQLYISLRRLNKKIWWLQYDKSGHEADSKPEQKDFTFRYTQFFDHYLKGAPAPRWMTQGIPAKSKSIEARYELDPSGSCALQGKNQCKICDAWNEQYKRTPEMFSKPINEWKLDNDIKNDKIKQHTKTQTIKK